MAPYLNENDESWLDVLARHLPEDPAPTVSVVIPTYNHGDYVAQAIESILKQTWQDLEIIVVDDGSTDHTRSVVERFGPRVRYIWQENQGLSAARNTGIRHAEGRYIGLLDADDLYEQDYLATLVEFLEDHTAIGAVYCGYRFVDQNNQPLPQVVYQPIDPEDFFDTLSEGNFLVPESILVRRSCYQEAGDFDENLTACEDWDMWLRISKDHKVAGIPKPLTRHRVLAGSMSSDPARMLNNRLAVLEKNFGIRPNGAGQLNDSHARILGRVYLLSAVEYLQQGEDKEAGQYFNLMGMVCPPLLTDLDTYYELGLHDQPKGYRGANHELDLDASARLIAALLQGFFESEDAETLTRGKISQANAYAKYALGLLAYNSGHYGVARRELARAVFQSPALATQISWLMAFGRSILGGKIIGRLKSLRGRDTPVPQS